MNDVIGAAKDLFRNYVNFTGRMPRAAYWKAMIVYVIGAVFVSVVAGATGFDILSKIYSLLMLLPILSASVKRYHDIGKSTVAAILFNIGGGILAAIGGFALIVSIIPALFTGGGSLIVGVILFLVFGLTGIVISIINIVNLCKLSDGDNEYGDSMTYEEYKGYFYY